MKGFQRRGEFSPKIESLRFQTWQHESQKIHVSSRTFQSKIHPIGRYDKKRESFDFHAAKFERGAMRFWGENSPRRWNPFKTRFPPLSFYYKEQSTANSNSFKVAQKTAFEAKGRLYTPQVR